MIALGVRPARSASGVRRRASGRLRTVATSPSSALVARASLMRCTSSGPMASWAAATSARSEPVAPRRQGQGSAATAVTASPLRTMATSSRSSGSPSQPSRSARSAAALAASAAPDRSASATSRAPTKTPSGRPTSCTDDPAETTRPPRRRTAPDRRPERAAGRTSAAVSRDTRARVTGRGSPVSSPSPAVRDLQVVGGEQQRPGATLEAAARSRRPAAAVTPRGASCAAG